MQIYVLRHGIAEDAAPGQPDSERALTEEGREKLREVLKRARKSGVMPTVILSSPYKRALETAEEAVEALGFSGKVERTKALTPDGDPEDLWNELRARQEEPAVLLASHEPFTSMLVAWLLDCPGLQVHMKKAALVRIDCDRFGPKPRGVLKWMITPSVA